MTDPVLAAASRIHRRATAGTPENRSVDLYKALRSVIVATLPAGEAGYAAYPARLEELAIRRRELLRGLFTRYGPRAGSCQVK
ncbi:hypothetical protein ACH4E7_44570 [Kitasatospora sp. NPDC018058]|uniref:hypothetical protein n=1 Tax=Kitasatospora sp. NPDC018058 TaxID=3364025 RepID=UPI0037BF59E5